MTAASDQRATTVLAAASRLGVRYRTSWPLAVLTGALILGTTAIDVVRTRDAMALVTPEGGIVDDPSRVQGILSVGTFWLIGFILSGIAWSLWIAIVVANVPALTARWPSRSPAGAFFALWIPIIGLKRPYSVVREVVAIPSGSALGPALLVIAWWLAFLAQFYLPTIVVFLRAVGHDDPTIGAAMSTGSATRIALVLVAAILAALVLVTVEYFQQIALERRSQAVIGPDSGAA
jgi:hypothetical protein